MAKEGLGGLLSGLGSETSATQSDHSSFLDRFRNNLFGQHNPTDDKEEVKTNFGQRFGTSLSDMLFKRAMQGFNYGNY